MGKAMIFRVTMNTSPDYIFYGHDDAEMKALKTAYLNQDEDPVIEVFDGSSGEFVDTYAEWEVNKC